MKPTPRRPRLPSSHQQGMLTVVTCIVLMLVAAMTVLYLNQGILLSLQTESNYARHGAADRMARSGIEWTAAMLNSPLRKGSPCRAAMCYWADTRLACHCEADASATLPSQLPQVAPSFSVSLTSSTAGLQLTARGCAAAELSCAAAGVDGAAVAHTVLLKPVDLIRRKPIAALTCAKDCQLLAGARISSTDPPFPAYLVRSGGNILGLELATLNTSPGTPVEARLLAQDAELAALASQDADCSQSALVRSVTDLSETEFAALPGTWRLNCTNSCSADIRERYGLGWRAFYLPAQTVLELDAGQTWGSPEDPLFLLAAGAVRFSGDGQFYGLILSTASQSSLTASQAEVVGAVMSCDQLKVGNLNIRYDSTTLVALQKNTQRWTPISGTWRDW